MRRAGVRESLRREAVVRGVGRAEGDGRRGAGRRAALWGRGLACFTVMDGLQPSSSLMMSRQTVPEGYTLGWKKLGGKRHFGGLSG